MRLDIIHNVITNCKTHLYKKESQIDFNVLLYSFDALSLFFVEQCINFYLCKFSKRFFHVAVGYDCFMSLLMQWRRISWLGHTSQSWVSVFYSLAKTLREIMVHIIVLKVVVLHLVFGTSLTIFVLSYSFVGSLRKVYALMVQIPL